MKRVGSWKTDFRKRLIHLGLCLALVLSLAPTAALAADGSTREEWDWSEMLTEQIRSASAGEEDSAGGIQPTAFWRSYTQPLPAAGQLYSSDPQVLPESYDLRDQGTCTTVKNQAPWGSCWAFGALSSLESNVLEQSGAVSRAARDLPDYSEHQLAWFAYEKQTQDTLAGSAAGSGQVGEGTVNTALENQMNRGGNMPQAASLLATWQGAADETEIPYENADGNIEASGDWGLSDSQRLLSSVRLTDADFLPSPTTYSEYGDNQLPAPGAEAIYHPEATEAIKRAILENGAVAIAYYADQSSPDGRQDGTYFNYTNWCQYVDEFSAATVQNHSVSIVGWDDTYSRTKFNLEKQPQGDGAWIVKNSWGNDWGTEDSGCFYLSYYDRTIDQVTSFQGERKEEWSYDNNYQYDYLSLASYSSMYDQSSRFGLANVFTAKGSEVLQAVSTVTQLPGSEVSVKVYRLREDSEDACDGELAASFTERVTYAGYHTLRLPQPIYLNPGERFSVFVEIAQIGEDGGRSYYLPIEIGDVSQNSSQTAVCNAGESYLVGNETSAADFVGGLKDVLEGDGVTVGNAMIKAFTVNVAPPAMPELKDVTYKVWDRESELLETKTLSDIQEPGMTNISLPGPTFLLQITDVSLTDGADSVWVASVKVNGRDYELGNALSRQSLVKGEDGTAPIVITVQAPSLGAGAPMRTYELDFSINPTELRGDNVSITDTNGYLPNAVTGVTGSPVSGGVEYEKIVKALSLLRAEEQFYVLELALNPEKYHLESGWPVNLGITLEPEYLQERKAALYWADLSGGAAVLTNLGDNSQGTGTIRADVDRLGYFVVAVPRDPAPSGGSGSPAPIEPEVRAGGGGKAQVGGGGTSVILTPDEGYEADRVLVNGKEVKVPENGVITGLKPGDVVEVEFVTVWENPFGDIKKGEWYYKSVRYVYEKGLFLGESTGQFAPDGTMTREMLATVLWRAAGKPKAETSSGFSEVVPGSYYEEAVSWARENGVVQGVSDTEFGVGSRVSRQDIAVMLWRMEGSPVSTQSLGGFADADKISDYAQPAMRWAVEQGLFGGKGGGILDAQGSAKRCEVAAILQRYDRD